ncbi:GC-rich sequence DNA-binding factor 2 isoform X1 [Anguilla anguilla]|nr:GC-rich sequence DNA-binding factor 2 isoform X1 [Anguilla anguilla]XP_035256506.1 GC-rich sequence DNA-binding factor 2 isoform X1 [Anguilla anguilla]
MFSKKPRRNFRTRRDESSEEEEQKTNEGEENSIKPAPVLRRSKLPQSRGISCSSKPEVATDETKSQTTAEDSNDKNKAVTDGELFQRAEKKENLKNDALNSSDVKEGGIPDAKLIRAALRRRREARARKDYIPLAREREGSHSSEEESERDGADDDDDDDDEDDDHERRIQFAPKIKTLRERVAEEMGGSDSEEDGTDSQEDEDQTMWEEQQIRKGVRVYKHSSQDTVRQKKKYNIPESLPQISIDVIKKRVSAKLETLRQVSRRSVMDLQRVQLDMDSAKATLEQLESGSSHEQHRFYKGMGLYTQNLLECLGEKVVEINAVELDMHTLLIDQAEVLLSRRRESVREVSTRLQLLAYGTDPSDNGHGDKAQLEVREQSQSCETADAEYENLPADDEPLPEEAAELCRKRDEILTKAENIFADVHKEFSDVKNILCKFNEWRFLFSESYDNAYISLCIPKLLAPLVRQQLIGWNPLNPDCKDIEAFPWYSAVEDFCLRKGCNEAENTDISVLKSIIEKSILPKIQGFVELIWDPLSTGQSQCLAGLCRTLLDDYKMLSGEQSKPVKALLEAVAVRLRSAVDVDVFIPLYPKRFLDDASSPQFQFRDKQFYSAVKLLYNITLWHGLVPEDVLIELGLTKLLSRYLMITLRSAPCERHSVEKCKKVAVCFPKSWFDDVDAGASIPELRMFSEHLHQTAHALCKKNPLTAITREIVTDLLILLRNMKALDSVTDIVETYHFEGF